MKKILIAVLILGVLAVVGVLVLLGNLDSIVERAIERVGGDATQAPVDVGSVDLSLTNGRGSIGEFVVGNPDGFTTAHAFSLGKIQVQIDTASLSGSGPIVIPEITVGAPHVIYELGGGGSNIAAIQRNVEAYAKRLGAGGQPTGEEAPPKSDAPERKLRIGKLSFNGGRVELASSLLGGQSIGADLPDFEMSDVGGEEGATPSEIAVLVLKKLSNRALRSAGKFDLSGLDADVRKQIEGMTESVDSVKEAIDDVKKGIGDLLGK